MKRFATILALAIFLVASTAEASIIYGFKGVTANNLVDVAIGEAQLSVEITDTTLDGGLYGAVGPNQIQFIFRNIGAESSSICDVYFADGIYISDTAVGSPMIVSSTGVVFGEGAKPKTLPGSPTDFDQIFSADSDPSVQPNGVNPGEWLSITYDLFPGGLKPLSPKSGAVQDPTIYGAANFGSVIDAIGAGELQIGIHVQGFDDDGSEGFVVVPEPTAVVIWSLLGMFGFGLRRWHGRAHRTKSFDVPPVRSLRSAVNREAIHGIAPPVRSPWAAENREAIHDIIGCK